MLIHVRLVDLSGCRDEKAVIEDLMGNKCGYSPCLSPCVQIMPDFPSQRNDVVGVRLARLHTFSSSLDRTSSSASLNPARIIKPSHR